MLPESGRKSRKSITFNKKVKHDDSSEATLLTMLEERYARTDNAEPKRPRSPPPPMGGAGHFLRLSKSERKEPEEEETAFPYGQFLQARNITPRPKQTTEKLEIRKEGFSTPKTEEEEVYQAELQLDTPNAIRAQLPDRTKLMCLIDTGATETLISETGIQDSAYLRGTERIPLRKPKKFLVGNGEYIVAKTMMKFQLRISSTNFTMIANIVPNIGGYKLVLGLDTLQDLKAEINL